MKKKAVRVGLFGIGRGHILWKYCQSAGNARLVAVCDKWEEGLERMRNTIGDDTVGYYTDFQEFIRHDMDAVYLANYATEHAPFAIAAMRAGKDVISEVLPVQTMAQAVQLLECARETGRSYCYAENFCYMAGPYEMRRLYRQGDLGEFEYGEGEYMHNCEPIWHQITRGEPSHWRNNMSAFYYCTHSVGPILHMTGLRPVKVVGVEGMFNTRMARMGAKAGHMAVELVTLENGAVFKSIHGVGPSKDSVWYCAYGSKGRLETAREDAHGGSREYDPAKILYANLDPVEGEPGTLRSYAPKTQLSEKAEAHGHGGSDYICMWNCMEHLLGNPDADVIELPDALHMWMVGFFGYLSVLEGGAPQEIPDLRQPEALARWRNDHRCTDPAVAGSQLQPSYSPGNPQIDPCIYDFHRKQWLKATGKG